MGRINGLSGWIEDEAQIVCDWSFRDYFGGQGEEKQMTGYQIYRRFMAGEALAFMAGPLSRLAKEDAMRNYLRKRDARRAKAKKSK
jgi:hypothetical protein